MRNIHRAIIFSFLANFFLPQQNTVMIESIPAITHLLLCSGAILAFLFTVSYTWYLWFSNNHNKDGIFLPAMSELGLQAPEKYWYQYGFGFIGALMFVHVELFQFFIAKEISSSHVKHKTENIKRQEVAGIFQKAIISGRVCALGATLQGIFTLENTASYQSIIHWTGAILFLMGAQSFTDTTDNLYKKMGKALSFLQGRQFRKAVSCRKFVLESNTTFMGCIMFLVPILWQISKRIGGLSSQSSPGLLNIMGAVQWILIFRYSLVFALYGIDAYYSRTYSIS